MNVISSYIHNYAIYKPNISISSYSSDNVLRRRGDYVLLAFSNTIYKFCQACDLLKFM